MTLQYLIDEYRSEIGILNLLISEAIKLKDESTILEFRVKKMTYYEFIEKLEEVRDSN